MLITRPDSDTIALARLDLFCAELLRQITSCARVEEGDPAADRIFSAPTLGKDKEADAEWKELVEPDLRELFESALDTVDRDLASFRQQPGVRVETLRIPISHLRSWVHSLNQARLALGARYGIDEKDMDEIGLGRDARSLAIFQIHFYGIIQERFLRELGQL